VTRKVLIPLLAVSTAFGTFATALAADPVLALRLHSSAQTLEQRVSERRALRQRTVERPTSDAAARRRARLNRRRLTPRVRTTTTPADGSLMLLRRRQERRNRRLAGKPVPIKQQLMDAVNMERVKQALAPLQFHKDLEISAQAHAEDMKNREYFSHENPEGLRSGDRIKKTGYGVINAQECRCSYRVFLGENIAQGQKDVEQVVEEWMASQSHREAMLSVDYREFGVGIKGDYWVLNFGSVEINPVQ